MTTAPGLLAQLQRNEYLRYGRDISRRQGRVFVLTGTASLFRADALAAVAAARGIRAARRCRATSTTPTRSPKTTS